MPLNVQIESWPASPDRPNEDWAGTQDDVVVVLDGAGIPKHLSTGCKHSVAWFVNQLGPSLLRKSTDRHNSLRAALESAILDVRGLHEDQCDLQNPNAPSATVLVFRLKGDVAEGLVLADSTLVISDQQQRVSAICDSRLQQLKARLTAEGRPPEPGSAMTQYRNQPGGFWVAGAQPRAAYESISIERPAESVTAVALLSDGAARCVDLFDELDWPELMERLGRQGPASVLGLVRDARALRSGGHEVEALEIARRRNDCLRWLLERPRTLIPPALPDLCSVAPEADRLAAR